jgi:hypothetical protein
MKNTTFKAVLQLKIKATCRVSGEPGTLVTLRLPLEMKKNEKN